MKKKTLITLGLIMAMTLTSCGGSDQATYTAGTYTGVGTGIGGDVKVSVTFTESEITAVTVDEQSETEGVADSALEEVPAAIVEKQTADVDTVAGATITSNAIIEAVKDCINQASSK